MRNGAELFPDEEGIELGDVRAAEMEAARALGGMARDLDLMHHGRDMVIEVRTDGGPVFEAALTFAISRPKH
ncbi:hypothetical protein XH89_12695 [Bradyrhizobium sp. CCBAU 53340]|uniref:DUF6894 family protein n=1 Tax=Bradyrhizobium sp. CCBAU 53340 TaxID=1325112 RepID=UPI0018C009EC|nr:hypothetical protein XH89_12695 [Bradyrhizobium sp. CCBAU 53340]